MTPACRGCRSSWKHPRRATWIPSISRRSAASWGRTGEGVKRVLWGLALCLSLPCGAWASDGFAYVWHEGPVTVRWAEGNPGASDAAVRSLVGHWKRLAVTAWAPLHAPLRIDVTLYGSRMGSGRPTV